MMAYMVTKIGDIDRMPRGGPEAQRSAAQGQNRGVHPAALEIRH